MYVKKERPAEEVGERLGISPRVVLRSGHSHGLPVRAGGTPSLSAADLPLLDMLYADPEVCQTIRRHGVPMVRKPGHLWQRFPSLVSLTTELVTDLHVSCGLSAFQIELLTGHPCDSPPPGWVSRLHCRRSTVDSVTERRSWSRWPGETITTSRSLPRSAALEPARKRCSTRYGSRWMWSRITSSWAVTSSRRNRRTGALPLPRPLHLGESGCPCRLHDRARGYRTDAMRAERRPGSSS